MIIFGHEKPASFGIALWEPETGLSQDPSYFP